MMMLTQLKARAARDLISLGFVWFDFIRDFWLKFEMVCGFAFVETRIGPGMGLKFSKN